MAAPQGPLGAGTRLFPEIARQLHRQDSGDTTHLSSQAQDSTVLQDRSSSSVTRSHFSPRLPRAAVALEGFGWPVSSRSHCRQVAGHLPAPRAAPALSERPALLPQPSAPAQLSGWQSVQCWRLADCSTALSRIQRSGARKMMSQKTRAFQGQFKSWKPHFGHLWNSGLQRGDARAMKACPPMHFPSFIPSPHWS